MDVQRLIDMLMLIEDKTKSVEIPVHCTQSMYEEASYIEDDGEVITINSM